MLGFESRVATRFLREGRMQTVLIIVGVAAGVAGLFMETHPRPQEAWSDGPNAVPLKHMKALLQTLVTLDSVTKQSGFLENHFNA